MADPECGGPSILEMLGDDDCRKILTAVEATALSASEIAESCDLSSSTTYRKVETLTDLGLLSRTVRIRANGVDVREYTLSTENILVRFQEDEGPRVQLAGPEVTEYLCGPQPD
jgi:DNA-binding transcriptional ArsR family regulator